MGKPFTVDDYIQKCTKRELAEMLVECNRCLRGSDFTISNSPLITKSSIAISEFNIEKENGPCKRL